MENFQIIREDFNTNSAGERNYNLPFFGIIMKLIKNSLNKVIIYFTLNKKENDKIRFLISQLKIKIAVQIPPRPKESP